MKRLRYAYALLCAPIVMLAACGGKKDDPGLPLAYAPADTAFVFGNTASIPVAITESRLRLFQPMWKPYFEFLDKMIEKGAAKADSADQKRALAYVRAILDEFRNRDTLAKWKELGFDPEARGAFYAIGLDPVLRVELADPAAFRAMLGRIEAKTGEKLRTAKAGDQEYWSLGPVDAALSCAVALEGKHLVVTLVPKDASEATLKTLLGVDRPAKNVLDAGTLAQLNKQRGYLDNGSGYVDVARLITLIADQHVGTDADFARALKLPDAPLDATCRTEIAGIAAKMPRLAAGNTRLDQMQQDVRFDVDFAPALAGQFTALAQPVPGMAASDDALLDVVLAFPVLKAKDFWLKQAEAVAAAPYQCAHLAKLNESFAEMKTSLDQTVPPPLSDLLGGRFTLDKLTLGAGNIPDPQQSAARVLIATSNPLLMTSMAQMAVPTMKDVRITSDGKPVAIPTAGLPMQNLALFAAASEKALAIAAGPGADTALPAYLASPAGDGKTFLRMRISGLFYKFYGEALDTMMSRAAPGDPDTKAMMDMQKQMYQLYAEFFSYLEVRFAATEYGLRVEETIKLNAPK